MKSARLFTLLLPCALAFGQNSDLFEKAPPQIDEALRSRVTIFYDAHITGKYREAMSVVAEDAIDEFIGSSRDNYKACEISKINYKEEFTKATVTMACKGDLRWHGQRIPATIPTLSTWKYVNGQWWWYHVKESFTMTPWGRSTAGAADPQLQQQASMIPPDPAAAAQAILKAIKLDKNELQLKSTELSKGEVHISNSMPGPITITVDRPSLAGVVAKVTPSELPAGSTATIVFSYDPNDPSILCNACSTKVQMPPMTANIRILPTQQVFPVTITFAGNPNEHKDLPKLPPEARKN